MSPKSNKRQAVWAPEDAPCGWTGTITLADCNAAFAPDGLTGTAAPAGSADAAPLAFDTDTAALGGCAGTVGLVLAGCNAAAFALMLAGGNVGERSIKAEAMA